MRLRSVSRSLRTRSNSCSGKVAFCTTSAMISSACCQCEVSVSAAIAVNSRDALARSCAPRNSISSEICWLVRVAVPSVSIAAVRLEMPGLSVGSVIPPARRNRPCATTGKPGFSSSTTFMPLESVARVGTGGLKALSGAASGIAVRSRAVATAESWSSGSTVSLTIFSPSAVLAARRTSSAVTAR